MNLFHHMLSRSCPRDSLSKSANAVDIEKVDVLSIDKVDAKKAKIETHTQMMILYSPSPDISIDGARESRTVNFSKAQDSLY